jgi:peptidoglycan/xylan/chitin deacetylase (PgdA/CDA1 family)
MIPKLVERKLIEFLNKEKTKNPKLFDIVQHGWSHKNYSKNLTNKYEFGSSRNYSQQKQDIAKGYKKMQRLFGKNFTPAFIPPYHGYNTTTLKIINDLKIVIFSANKINILRKKQFIDLPVGLSLNQYPKQGVSFPFEAMPKIKSFLEFLSNPNKLLGILFHHNALESNKDLFQMKLFLSLIKNLSKEDNFKFILFSGILNKNFPRT